MHVLTHVLTIALLAAGLVFFLGGTLGLLRMPDFYTRLHPAGKMDTLGSLALLGGLVLHHLASGGSVLVGLKILLILAFIFAANPTAVHAITDAGLRAGLKPWRRGEARR
jgi:multicomponent Na+:H+ antiporter subunit G